MHGNMFAYRCETGEVFNFNSTNMSLKETGQSESKFCHFNKAQDYKCIYSSRSTIKHLGLYPRWFSKCCACDKFFHIDCFVLFAKSQPSVSSDDGYTKTASGKSCMKGMIKSSLPASTTPGTRWNNDGPKGIEDNVNSLSILLNWITTFPNYADYRGASDSSTNLDEAGKSKLHYCKEISDIIKNKGVVVERTPDAIRSKIQSIERSWREAHDFLNATGSGIMEDAVET